MEISDAISIYQFLGQLGFWASTGFLIIVWVIVFAGLIATLRPAFSASSTKAIAGTLSSLTFVCLIFLSIEAHSRAHVVANANKIKSYLVANNCKVVGLKRLQKSVYLHKDSEEEAKMIHRVLQAFPDEFAEIKLTDPNDKVGIRLLDLNVVTRINKNQMLIVKLLRSDLETRMIKDFYQPFSVIMHYDPRYDLDIIELLIANYPNEYALVVKGNVKNLKRL